MGEGQQAFKRIDAADLTNKGVVGQENTPGLSAREMQEKVEEIARKVIIPAFNVLVDALTGGSGSNNIGVNVPAGLPVGTENNVNAVFGAVGVELLKRVISDDVKKIRLNEYGELEVSTDGVDYAVASSRGHIVLDDRQTFSQRRKLKFRNAEVEDHPEADETVVYGLTGPRGPAGKNGVITDLKPGLFGLYVDDFGNLYLQHNDGEPTPPFALTEDKMLVYNVSDEIQINLGHVGGENGKNGKTPEKGVDYWTNADQQSIVNDVLQALPKWDGGAY